MSNSTANASAASFRNGVNKLEYDKFAAQGANLASTDLMGLNAREEYATITTDKKSGAKIYNAEKDFMSMSQDTLDKMMSMFYF